MTEIQSNQWLGMGSGDNQFHTILLNLDELESHCEGTFYAFETNRELPSICGHVRFDDKKRIQKVSVSLIPFSQEDHRMVSRGEFTQIWPNADMSMEAELDFIFHQDFVDIHWTSQAGLKGNCRLYPFSDAKDLRKEVEVKKLNWNDFKSLVQEYPYEKYVFRGEAKPWPITTSFHRTSRKNLAKYLNEDVPDLQRILHPYIGQAFDDHNEQSLTAFFHLLQHHGYPTPLVDWTYSPYIASYFAFSSMEQSVSDDEFVRIYVFDLKNWNECQPKNLSLICTMPHASFVDVVPIKNARSIPQQGTSMITNCFGVENYIQLVEHEAKKTFLTAIDISTSMKNVAMDDLRKMGITPASLFPGIDGSCQHVKQHRFKL